MKPRKTFILCIAFMVAGWASPVFAADAVKIGVIDFQKVATESESGKSIKAMMDKRGKEMEGGLRDLGTQIDQLTEQLNKDAMVLTKEKRDEKQRELEIKKYDFQTLKNKYQSEFNDLQEKIYEKTKKEIVEIAKEMGQKEGYLIIIERSVVLYYQDAIDMTDKLIEAYNKKYPGDKVDLGKLE